MNSFCCLQTVASVSEVEDLLGYLIRDNYIGMLYEVLLYYMHINQLSVITQGLLIIIQTKIFMDVTS